MRNNNQPSPAAKAAVRAALDEVAGPLPTTLGDRQNLTTEMAITAYELPKIFWNVADALNIHDVMPDDYLKSLDKTGEKISVESLAAYLS